MNARNETVRLKDIAENLGLSIGTVQRALNNKGGYTEETRKRIIEEADRMGYITNQAASALRREPYNIAVILPSKSGNRRFFFNAIWEGINNAEKEVAIYNTRLLKYEVEQGIPEFESLLEMANLKALITNTHTEPEIQRVIEELRFRNIPVYTIDGDPDENLQKAGFKITIPHQGDLAADIFRNYLSDKVGTVLLLSGSKMTRRQTKRALDFCNAMATKCPNASVMEIHMTGNSENAQDITRNLLTSMKDLIGIYSLSAIETVEMCKIIKELGRSGSVVTIGTDIHYVMLPFFEDDTLLCTIFQSPVLQGYQAVKLLTMQLLGTERDFKELIIPPSIVFKSIASDYCAVKLLY